MRRALLWFALALLAGAGLLELIEKDSGYVLIAFGGTSVEMSVWAALALVVLLWLLVWLIKRLVRGSYSTTRRAFNAMIHGHSRRAQRSTARGLIDFMEGNWKPAHRQLLKSVGKAEVPLINYLAAARSAYELGDQDEAFRLLHRAEKSAPNSELAVALTQARMQLLDKKYEQCVATLERAKRVAPKHPVVLDLLRQVYLAVQDWQGLKHLLPELRRNRISTPQELDRMEEDLCLALLAEAGERAAQKVDAEKVAELETQWYSFPAAMHKKPRIVEAYARLLMAYQGGAEAEAILRKALQKNWHEPLLDLYGRVEGQDSQRQLLEAEAWLKERPGNARVMLTLGRLCLRNKQWGRARQYLESSLRLQKCPETYGELARLLASLGEHEKSTEYYQQGLMLITQGLPELPQPQLSN